ncbi:Alpha/Beta hydrolase protein [Dichotomopilus funicola]|uniref:Alpha/Beta hydrolase protein n=1 Tax=Dichotomopilus funicola TaxID=1934379 RepID=A0AAN6UVM6_9PEZI|nr:Alpha/Beta hydrolase protein [Dichotomopilus funicola]
MTGNSSGRTTGTLSVWERISLVGLIPWFTARWLFGFVFHGNPELHWRQRLAVSLLRAQRATFAPSQLRWLSRRTSTRDAIVGYSKEHGLAHRIITLKTVATTDVVELDIPPPSLHFLAHFSPTERDGDSGLTLLYFHGGGFVNPLRKAAHMPFIHRCATAGDATRVVIVEYGLAPEHPYPAQMVQCIAALRYLVDEMDLDPGKIVLGGDSAGGQLVGAVLVHLARPSPYAPPLTLRGKLKAALLVSPWAVLPSSCDGSYRTNARLDYLNQTIVDQFQASWKGNENEIWANLYGVEEARAVWRKIVPNEDQGIVGKILVTAGTAEVFLDGCRAVAKDGMGAETVVIHRDIDCDAPRGKTLVLAECQGEVHVQSAVDCAVAFDGGLTMRAITSWLATI